MGCGVMPDGSYECADPCDCGASWYWEPAPELNKRFANGDDFAGDAWRMKGTGRVHYVSVGVTPSFVHLPFVPCGACGRALPEDNRCKHCTPNAAGHGGDGRSLP